MLRHKGCYSCRKVTGKPALLVFIGYSKSPYVPLKRPAFMSVNYNRPAD